MMRSINVDSMNPVFSSVDGVVYSKDSSSLIRCPEGKFNIRFPQKILTVTSSSFHGCSELKQISFPPSIRTLEPSAFEECNGLDSLFLNLSLTAVPERCFVNCKGLQKVRIASSIEVIDEEAFMGCSALKEIELGHVVIIQRRAFTIALLFLLFTFHPPFLPFRKMPLVDASTCVISSFKTKFLLSAPITRLTPGLPTAQRLSFLLAKCSTIDVLLGGGASLTFSDATSFADYSDFCLSTNSIVVI